jgi:hypothetical protein
VGFRHESAVEDAEKFFFIFSDGEFVRGMCVCKSHLDFKALLYFKLHIYQMYYNSIYFSFPGPLSNGHKN